MINLIRKYFDRKWNKPNMYISNFRILDDICQYTVIIQGEKTKGYRIRFSYSDHEYAYGIILSIILFEDVSTIYYDPWDNYQLIELLAQLRSIKLECLRGHDIKKYKDLENEIEEDIIDIQINKNINND